MSVLAIRYSSIRIREDRQRKEFSSQALVELADSIQRLGLIHPIVITPHETEAGVYWLLAGERRLRALKEVWETEANPQIRCGEGLFSSEEVPCTLFTDLSPLDQFEVELEENIQRQDITWQERSVATAKLFELRKQQALARNETPPTVTDISAELYGENTAKGNHANVRTDIIVSKHLNDADVAKASTAREAFKIIKRKEELKRAEQYGQTVKSLPTESRHKVWQGNCIEVMAGFLPESFDVILTDPPYGINAHEFNSSDGKAVEGGHDYDDSLESWRILMPQFLSESFRIAKANAHLYAFCDIDNFVEFKQMATAAGWKCFRTPLIWHNPGAARLPWIESGPQRKYQICLYAVKGSKRVVQIFPDLVTYRSDPNLNHSAQKPVDLYIDLLKRSCYPGESVIDPFCGTGTIFPAAHELDLKATGIEQHPAFFGIAKKRLEDLP